jgi:hypothetical protein
VKTILARTEGGNELGGETDCGTVLDEDAQAVAELNDNPGHDCTRKIDFGEMDAFALGTRGAAGGTVSMGWFLCHPPNLPAAPAGNHEANLETLT